MYNEKKIKDLQNRLLVPGLRPEKIERIIKQLKAWGVKRVNKPKQLDIEVKIKPPEPKKTKPIKEVKEDGS